MMVALAQGPTAAEARRSRFRSAATARENEKIPPPPPTPPEHAAAASSLVAATPTHPRSAAALRPGGCSISPLLTCPTLRKVPHVLVIHGEDGASLELLKWPEFRVNLPVDGDVNINAAFFRKFDYSSSMMLIGSVPGYHLGPNIKKWGHMKLRSVLEGFSSLGSLDEKWMDEFACSLSSGKSDDDGLPLGIGKPLIVWPTVEDVRCSIEGYAAGSCIPSPQKNVEKDFLKKYWARWKADHVGHCRAMPHIKIFTRYNGQNITWFLLTSSNLSKAAWGALQKNNTQLMIRSYEVAQRWLSQLVERFSVENLHIHGGKWTDAPKPLKLSAKPGLQEWKPLQDVSNVCKGTALKER
ncbi:hypothetical protein ACP4OV_027112 [Aristida adscensionis]